MAICGRAGSSSNPCSSIAGTLAALRMDTGQRCDVQLAGTARLGACDGASLHRERDRFGALFDGRIDNPVEVRRALNVGAGEALSTSALMLRAWQAWGDGFCHHVVGDYSCAIWDTESRQLIMATDPGGFRPLFYRAIDGQILFASEQRGILADPATPIEIDEHQLVAWLALLPRDPERSFFKDVRRVPPGSLVVWRAGHLRVARWWRPEALPALKLRTDADYQAALRDALDRAVRCRLGAGEAVGANLSGGLDSSSVTAMAARALGEAGRRLLAFTAAPSTPTNSRADWFADEWPHAAAVAAMHGNIEHIRVANDATSLTEALRERESAQDWPLLNPVNAIWVNAIEREAGRRKLDALLIGAAGNYSISHHGNAAFATQLRHGRLGTALATARARHRNDGHSWRALIREGVTALLPEALVRSWDKRANGKSHRLDDYSVIDPLFLRESGLAAFARETAGDLSNIAGRDSQRLRILGLQRSDHLGIQFGSARRLYGVDVRDPTSDRRLVELCLSIPDERFSSGGIPRNLIRQTMKGLLPDLVRNERRRGQQSADWQAIFDQAIPGLKAQLDLLRESPLASRALDLDRIGMLLDRWPDAVAASNDAALRMAYRLAVSRGMATGGFIRRMELAAGTSRSDASPGKD